MKCEAEKGMLTVFDAFDDEIGEIEVRDELILGLLVKDLQWEN